MVSPKYQAVKSCECAGDLVPVFNDTQTGNALDASQPALPDSKYDFRDYNERPGFVQRLTLIANC